MGELVTLDWTVDEAMTFVISGGTTAPDRIRFSSHRSGASPAAPRLDAAGTGSEVRHRGAPEVSLSLRSGAGCRSAVGALAVRDPAT